MTPPLQPYWLNDCDLCTRCQECRVVVCLDTQPEALCDTCRTVVCEGCGHDDCEGAA